MTSTTSDAGPDDLLDRDLARYEVPLLRDPALQEQLRSHGYARHDPVLSAGDRRQLLDLADEFLSRLGGPVGDLFLTVGRVEDRALRAEIIERAAAIVRPAIARLFVEGAQLMASAFQVKPPTPTSELNPHQDSSLVDEDRWPGVYAWIPLVDTDERNGGLEVLPGSHRFGNRQRTLSVPWAFAGMEDVLRPHCVPLTVPAGGVVFFDSATVHASPPNRSEEVRVALNNFARPPGAELLHFYLDEDTEPGQVEVFEIDPSFLYGDDIMRRPGPRHRALGPRPHQALPCDAATLEAMCRAVTSPTAAGPR